MSILGLLLGAAGLTALIWSIADWSMRRDLKRSEDIIKRIDYDPSKVEVVQLRDTGLIEIAVQLRGGSLQRLYAINGAAAVRYYDQLKRAAPWAKFSDFTQ